MSDRLAVFNRGRIEQVGAPADVYEHPATRFVAGFVGTSNLLTGEVARRRRRDRRHLHDPAREDPAGGARHHGRRRRGRGRRPDPRRRLPRLGHPLHRQPRRRGSPRRPSPEPRHVVDGGARTGRHRCPPDLEATARTPRLGRGVTRGGGARMMKHRILALAAVAAIALGACSSGVTASTAPSAARAPHRAPRAAPRREAASAAEPAGPSSAATAGRPQCRGLAGLCRRQNRRRADHRPRLGDRLPERDRVHGQREGRRRLGQMRPAHGRPAQYDGISASGDATLRLVRGGYVSRVNLSLFTNYKDIFEGLKNQPYNTVNGVSYGVPHGRGSNLLMYGPDGRHHRRPTPGARLRRDSPYKVKVSVYDTPIYIADAARVPDEDPAGPRDQEPLRPRPHAVRRGRRAAQAAEDGDHQVLGRPPKQIDGFRATATCTIGTTWQIITNLLHQTPPEQGRQRSSPRRARPAGPTPG